MVKREGEGGEFWALNNTWCGVDRKPRPERGHPSIVSSSAWTQYTDFSARGITRGVATFITASERQAACGTEGIHRLRP